MKKLVVIGCMLAGGLFLSGLAVAAGNYDGIWQADNFDFVTINENSGQLVAVILDHDEGEWEAYIGTLSGNYVRFSTIVGFDVSATYDVYFNPNFTATATQISCVPRSAGASCDYPNGTSFNMQKIW
jgi:hypothetical protein